MGGYPTNAGPGKVGQQKGIDQLAAFANTLTQRSNQLFKQTKPVFTELINQTLEALKTGGVGARIPIIQRAVEASKAATGQALAGTSSSLAGGGISGPYAANILSQQRQAGATQAANIPTDIAQGIISGAPGLVQQGFGTSMQAAGQGSSALYGASSLDLSRQQQNQEEFAKFMEDLKQTAQSLGTGIGAGF